jgi:hypothetical protein
MLRRLDDRIRELRAKTVTTIDTSGLYKVLKELRPRSTSTPSALGNGPPAIPFLQSGDSQIRPNEDQKN